MRKIYFLILIFSTFCATAFSNQIYWNGSSGGNWSTGSNWTGGIAPGINDQAVFQNNTTVIVDANIQIASLSIGPFQVFFQGKSGTTTITLANATASSDLPFRIEANGVLTLSGTTEINSCSLINNNSTKVFEISGVLNIGIPLQTANQYYQPGFLTNGGPNTNIDLKGRINVVGANASVIPSYYNWNTQMPPMIFNDSSVLDIQRDGGYIPQEYYTPGSKILISGTVTTYPNFGGVSSFICGTLEFNAPNNTILGSNGIGLIEFTGYPPGIICQNFIVSNTGSGTCTLFNSIADRALNVKGNLFVASGAILNITSTTPYDPSLFDGINVNGNVTIDGTLTANGNIQYSYINFSGSAPQTASFSGTILNNITFKISNVAGVTVTTDWYTSSSLTSQLILYSGNINMGANLLYIQNPSPNAIVGGTVNSHIIGKLRRATNTSGAAYNFPVSNINSELATVAVTPSTANSNYTIQFFTPNTFNSLAIPVSILSIGNYYWDIQQNAGTGANLNFSYEHFSNGGLTMNATIRVLHWNGNSWDNLGGTDAVNYSVNVYGVTSFSPFSLGSSTIPLPVQLNDFIAYKNNNTILLNWRTASEESNIGFEILRSGDGINFDSISFVKSLALNGNSSNILSYKYSDNSFNGLKQYYRLKQINQNGKYKISNTILVNDEKSSPLSISRIAPNPVKEIVNIYILAPSNENSKIVLTDINGKIILQKELYLQSGSNLISMDVRNLPAGSYFIRIINRDNITNAVTTFLKLN